MDRRSKQPKTQPGDHYGRDGRHESKQRVEPVALHSALIAAAFESATKLNPERDLVYPDRTNVRACKEADFDAILHASDGLTPHEILRGERQLYALVTKHEDFSTSISATDRKVATLNKFVATQRRNRITRKRLKHYLNRWSRMRPTISTVLGSAQLDVFRLLGAGPTDEDLRRFVSAKPFSVGVVQGLKNQMFASKSGHVYLAKDTNAYGKLDPVNTLTITSSCLRAFGHVIYNGSYGEYLLSQGIDKRGSLTKSSIGTVVPKDATVDRFIAVEPLGNSMVQQGIASMLAHYLRKWQIYLENQNRNRELARRASTIGFSTDGWATIDLSSASDTIVYELVKYLLPEGWFKLLDAARTSQVEVEKEVVPGYSSFCTMGNAFTFPLQCLIFGALTRACMRETNCGMKEYRVYGDDIIAPIPSSALLVEALRFCGFVPNTDKTFVTGFFRESCGGDYLCGYDVRPIYIRKSLSAATTRHSFFNLLQRSSPSHPCLLTLLEAESKPLVGPVIDAKEIVDQKSAESRWYEAPASLFRKFMVSSGKYKDNHFQCAVYRVPGMIACPKKIKRNDATRALLASISGSPGEEHDLRGVVTYRVKEVVVIGGCRLRRYSPYWF